MNTDHHPCLGYRARQIAFKVDSMLEYVCGMQYPRLDNGYKPQGLYDDGYLGYRERYMSRIARIGEDEVRPEFKRLGDTYGGMPVLEYLKAAYGFGFETVARIPSTIPDCTVDILVKAGPPTILVVLSRTGQLVEASIKSMIVDGGKLFAGRMSCEDGLGFLMALEPADERVRPDRWCRANLDGITALIGILVTHEEFKHRHEPLEIAGFDQVIDTDWLCETEKERGALFTEEWREILDLDGKRSWIEDGQGQGAAE